MSPLIALALLALAGCEKTPPPFVTLESPAIPAECQPEVTRSPPEPRLPAEDISDLAAVRDREALKTALRTEKAYRKTCGQRLRALFPDAE